MRRKNKGINIVLIVVLLIGVTIGYAVINTTLNINGKSSISKNTWDVYFNNVVVRDGSAEAVKIPTVTDKTTVDFEVALNLPGDFYEFTVDVVNAGSIDAMIDDLNKTPNLTTIQAKYLNYIIEYQNGEEVASKQLVKSNEFVRLKIRVEYKSDITASDLPTTSETLNLGFIVNYVQSDGSGVSVNNNGAWVVPIANGSLDDIGTIVTIGTEKFYTIGTEGDNVKLLSMYNLHVGNEVTNINEETEEITMNVITNPTGMQSLNAKGISESFPFVGTTAFSSTGTSYIGSIVEGYVNNYKTLLESNFLIKVEEARLITYEELTSEKIGCIASENSCINAPSWIYLTSYWALDEFGDSLWTVDFGDNFLETPFYIDFALGVRPVIIIPKSDIKVEVKPVANGSLDDIGTIVTIGTEQFYTIGTEGDNVKLLSMYNLYVGNECTSKFTSSCTPYGDEATGMQNSTMQGYKSAESIRKGVIKFSNGSSYYSGSIVEGYVNNYKILLESKFLIKVEEARLITYDELTSDKIGCNADENYCRESWIFTTSYWIDDDYNGTSNSYLRSNGIIGVIECQYPVEFGVRPVIVISKFLF